LDKSIPVPKREIDKPFLMPVEDVFSITGRGTVAPVEIDRGKVKSARSRDGGLRHRQEAVVTGVEMFRKLLDEGQAGDNVGLLFAPVLKRTRRARHGVGETGSIKPHTQFEAEV